ncbi:MAG: molybdenum cofactor biosynthesis protein MoaE [Candidatus Latescibacteria bacterium]|nr:molybdenum cofactor biosynthesis protein MoaE [Candidatus Latescibacterota bacterium]MCK5526561.1 molybdenum cofactor biosynthesis protein MoaE [Candidatus Latescibacterota bacterium]MCK5732765.1 molybdenum cofactor biosynthesis protein MoaE [Candidatus Latescibacterota bacterium]
MFRIVEEEISLPSVLKAVEDEKAGCVLTFIGCVRDHTDGKRVLALEYEAFKEMAERKLSEIGAEIAQRWGLDKVSIVHRTGHLKIGETSVVIAVAAPHRAEAFDACRYAIDRIKEIVPIWKKEIYENEEKWAGGGVISDCGFGISN